LNKNGIPAVEQYAHSGTDVAVRVSMFQVWLSVLACVSYFSIGGMMGLLGPAIPALAESLGEHS
jgi:hypothetical protein